MSISTLKVSELKDLLKEHNCAIPAGSNKQKLIELAEEVMSDQVLENQLEFEEFFEKVKHPLKLTKRLIILQLLLMSGMIMLCLIFTIMN